MSDQPLPPKKYYRYFTNSVQFGSYLNRRIWKIVWHIWQWWIWKLSASERYTVATDPIYTLKYWIYQRHASGEGTSYVGQYGMLGYTWVIFEKFSVLFREMGTFFQQNFCIFFCKVGIYFEENFCICQTRWNPFTRNFLYFIPQSCCILHIKFLYISTGWESFQEIYCSGWNQL